MKNKTLKIGFIIVVLVATIGVFAFFYNSFFSEGYKNEKKVETVPLENKKALSDDEAYNEEHAHIDEEFFIVKGYIENVYGNNFDLLVDFKKGESDYIFKDKENISFSVSDKTTVKRMEDSLEDSEGNRVYFSDMNVEDISKGEYVKLYIEKDYSDGLIARGVQLFPSEM